MPNDEPRFHYDSDLDADAANIEGVPGLVRKGWCGIVDEEAGGYVAYAQDEATAAKIVAALAGPSTECPYGCGPVTPVENANDPDPKHKALNPWACPKCGGVGGGEDFGLFQG